VATLIFWWWSGCGVADLDDCRVVAGEACEVFVPEGLLCGLAHDNVAGHPGSACGDHDPGDRSADRCPPGMAKTLIPDHDSGSGGWVGCAAPGNADRSSADFAEVPRGAACGWNTVGSGGTSFPCDGHDPTLGECPPGTSLRFLLDVFADVPEGGDQARLGAHVNVFCEVDEGCDPADEACRREGMVLWPRPGTSVLHVPLDKSVLTDELSPELRPAYDAWILAWKSGNGELAVGCPEGTEQACTSDWYGSTGHIQPSSACWCTEVGAAQPCSGWPLSDPDHDGVCGS
jgi:hypothetical protein